MIVVRGENMIVDLLKVKQKMSKRQSFYLITYYAIAGFILEP